MQRLAHVESRLARCLVAHSRSIRSDKLVLTQESMAQMIGARRNSVSLVANTLQQANFIRYSRGHIEIIDPAGSPRPPANATQRSRPSTSGCFVLACRERCSHWRANDLESRSGLVGKSRCGSHAPANLAIKVNP